MGKSASDPIAVLRGHRTDVHAVQFHPTLPLLYSGDADGELKVWSLDAMRQLETHKLHAASAGIITIALARCSSEHDGIALFDLISQGRDGTVRVWALDVAGSLPSRDAVREFCSGSYNFCRFSICACVALRADVSRTAEMLPTDHSTVSSTAAGADSPSNDASQPSAGGSFAESLLGTAISAVPSIQAVVEAGFTGSAAASSLHRPGADQWLIAVAGEDPAIAEVWDLDTCRRLHQLRYPEGGGPKLGMCMSLYLFRPAGRAAPLLAVGYEAGHVALWDTSRTLAPLAVTRLHEEPVLSLFADAQGSGGASGAAEDKVVCFACKAVPGEVTERARLGIPKPGIDALALRPDQRIFAAGGWDGRVRIFHYGKAKPLTILKYHTAAVPGLAFKNDGNMLASCSRDGTIALWRIF